MHRTLWRIWIFMLVAVVLQPILPSSHAARAEADAASTFTP